jgi:hypothetical protein
VKVVFNSFITVLVTLASCAILSIFPFVPLNFFVGSLIWGVASFACETSIQHAAVEMAARSQACQRLCDSEISERRKRVI